VIMSVILAGVIFCAASVYCFYRANYCACNQAGHCDNPVNQFWLAAISNAVISLLLFCLALHVELGTLLWLTMMCGSALATVIYLKQRTKHSLLS
jgi:hypothetical protein